jgi:hypothetical protein
MKIFPGAFLGSRHVLELISFYRGAIVFKIKKKTII